MVSPFAWLTLPCLLSPTGTYYNPAAKPYAFNMTHVEILIGGDTGEATIGEHTAPYTVGSTVHHMRVVMPAWPDPQLIHLGGPIRNVHKERAYIGS
jgi:hypothetical protein